MTGSSCTASSSGAGLRIASLLASNTDIVAALGLTSNLVGITHECDIPDGCAPGFPLTLTKSLFDQDATTQYEIDAKVKEAAALSAAANTCPLPSSASDSVADGVQSLYPIQREALKVANPNVILTQDLCSICAPSTGEVKQALAQNKQNTNDKRVKVVSLGPETLQDVAETFVTVADACDVHDTGVEVRDKFLSNLQLLQDTVNHVRLVNNNNNNNHQWCPRVFLLEWVDPPFDGGHWIPGMIEAAGCTYVKIGSESSPLPESWNRTKSKQVTWEDINNADPDVVLVACCGFDLRRNIKDTLEASQHLAKLRAAKEGRVYAANGDFYARPGPHLLDGASIVALCAFDRVDRNITDAVEALEFTPKNGEGWANVDIIGAPVSVQDIHDIQDIGCEPDRC